MGVEFIDEQQQISRSSPSTRDTGLIKLVINLGLAKDRKGALVVLLGVLVVCTIVTVFSFTFGNGSAEISEEERARIHNSTPLPPSGRR